MYQKLFTPIKIRSMELKNRIVLPAMGTKFSGKTSYVTDQLIDYHVARVKGGTGLSIVEVCSVHSPSAPRGFLSISEDCYIPGMKRLTDAIHENGGKAGLHPGAVFGPKGSAVRRLKWYASWVQNVVRQFGPYLSWA